MGETALYEEILKVAATGKIVLNLGGAWIGRLAEHEDEGAALTYLRTKAFRSGQEMRQVQLGLPSAVGGTTVTAPRPQPLAPASSTLGSASTSTQESQLGNGAPFPSTPAVEEEETVLPGSQFPPVAKPPAVRRTEEPATGINLSGCFERWRVPSGTTLSSARLEFKDVSVQQIKQILQRLPSAFRASLEISYQEDEP